jgi:hypothetical protein
MMAEAVTGRTPRPYDDLEVLDARAPRANQAVIGAFSLVAIPTGTGCIVALPADGTVDSCSISLVF